MRTILLIEDDEAFRYAAAKHLSQAGYAVIEAATTNLALDELDLRGSIDLAVIDVQMPLGAPHGFAFGRMAKARRPDLPMIFITAFSEILEAEGNPPGAVLLKPINLNELTARIEARLGVHPAT